jgi:hypothetical protein
MKGAKIAFKIPMKMKRLLSLCTRVNHSDGKVVSDYAPVDQRSSVLALQEHFSHPPSSVK